MSQALTRYGANKNVVALGNMLSFLQANPQIRTNLIAAGKTIAGQAAHALGIPVGTSQTSSGLVSGFSGVAGRPKRMRTRITRRKSRSARLNSGPARSISYTPRMKFKFIVPVTTLTTTGINNFSFWPGYADSTATQSMSTISSQYTQLAGVFKYQHYHSIQVDWEPFTAYTTSGWAGAQVFPDPTIAGNSFITTAQLYTQRQHNFITDVKEKRTLTWAPVDEQQAEAKEIGDASLATGAPRRNYAPGLIFLGVTTNLTSGATLAGHFVITMDLTFSGLA